MLHPLTARPTMLSSFCPVVSLQLGTGTPGTTCRRPVADVSPPRSSGVGPPSAVWKGGGERDCVNSGPLHSVQDPVRTEAVAQAVSTLTGALLVVGGGGGAARWWTGLVGGSAWCAESGNPGTLRKHPTRMHSRRPPPDGSLRACCFLSRRPAAQPETC